MPTILITGGSRGIGAELVQQYAADGWDVIATARSDSDLKELDGMDNVTAMELDVAKPDSVAAFIDGVGDRPIDVFLNSAGVYGPRTPERDGWMDVLEINVVAPTLLAEKLKPNVAASEKKVMAVVTSRMGSIGDNGGGGSIPYRSSKAAVNAAWKSLSIDWKDDGIAIVMLHPGWVKTDMGGDNAQIDTKTSVDGLRDRIAETDLSNSGRFVAYDGATIEW
ncbi:SDR family oxidoreductase [Novosphingopyxis sp. YJ-S2-01]|uniref:SDR family oxidoreductase n=1 Tax=Novosphingopyxis sp. YJ-S2-01 TaxID=2794021 RepID=UPI0018DC3965|nr:SDR family oxidoreductase [Novosphingopyxis sp. YJ-S2-01]MBH9536278.1 SDR family oxidoreductase [Novosphingopyxis sp. YJ-S2-01]